MKKIKNMILAIIGCLGLIILAACSSNSLGLSSSDIDMNITTTKDKATIKLTLSENDNIKNSKAVLYITCYTVADDSTETYHSKQNVTFSNSVYTSSTVTFSSLTANKNYKFTLYATYNGSDSKILEKTAKTTDTVSTTIENKDDFKNNLPNDLDGEFTLTADIDFDGDSLSLFTTESKAFQGKLDGGIYDADGKLTGCHKLTNFKLGSNSYVGLFGYLKNATIKNLIIEDVTIDFTSRSSASMGALAGYAVGSYVENVTINNASFKIGASSLAEHNTGAVVGLAERSTFKNVYANDAAIDYTSARVKINVGLFAGSIQGEALSNDGFVISSGAKGSIKLVADYASSGDTTEYINCGGFVGQVGSNGKIDDCYSVAEITYSRKATMARTFDLSIGGFVGYNNSNMDINNSLAINTIKAYAGSLPTDGDGHDYTTEKFASGNTYVGGFIGHATNVFRGIKNSYAKAKEEIVAEGTLTVTETVNEVETTTTIGYVDAFAGKVDTESAAYIINSSAITAEVPESLSATLKALLA